MTGTTVTETAKVFALNLTKSGYGIDYDRMVSILSKLTDKELKELAYNCYRTAEKCGPDAFDCVDEFNW